MRAVTHLLPVLPRCLRVAGCGAVLCAPFLPLSDGRRAKGHSKWQNVKHTKEVSDLLRSQRFAKLTYKIQVAIQCNNNITDPRLNRDLEKLLEICRSESMPKATIQRAIDRALSKPVKKEYYDVKGPGGSLYIVEMLTHSRELARSSVARAINKVTGFSFADLGIRSLFDEVGVVTVGTPSSSGSSGGGETKRPDSKAKASHAAGAIEAAAPDPPPLDAEAAFNLALEVAAEEVNETRDENGEVVFEFLCPPMEVNRLATALRARNFRVLSEECEFRSTSKVTLNPTQSESVTTFYKILQNNELLSRVYDNIESEES